MEELNRPDSDRETIPPIAAGANMSPNRISAVVLVCACLCSVLTGLNKLIVFNRMAMDRIAIK